MLQHIVLEVCPLNTFLCINPSSLSLPPPPTFPPCILCPPPFRCRMRCAVGWGDVKTTAKTHPTHARTDRCRSWWIAFHFIPHCITLTLTLTELKIERSMILIADVLTLMPDSLSFSLIILSSTGIPHFFYAFFLHYVFLKCVISFPKSMQFDSKPETNFP